MSETKHKYNIKKVIQHSLKAILFVCLSIFAVNAQADMSSSHYYISRDSLNAFGTDNSTSPNYNLSDTGGEIASGYSDSSNYLLHAGFRQFEEYRMNLICHKEDVDLTPVRLTGQSVLNNNYVDCTITTNHPNGYTFQGQAETDELIQVADPTYKIEKITNNTPDFWPSTLTNGTGWGGHLGTESDNFDATKWGNSNDYDPAGAKWAAFQKDSVLEIINKDTATDENGDTERIYFGMEVDDQTVIPPGEYETVVQFTALPVF